MRLSPHCFGGEQAKRAGFGNRGKSCRLFIHSIFKISKNNDSRFCMTRLAIRKSVGYQTWRCSARYFFFQMRSNASCYSGPLFRSVSAQQTQRARCQTALTKSPSSNICHIHPRLFICGRRMKHRQSPVSSILSKCKKITVNCRLFV